MVIPTLTTEDFSGLECLSFLEAASKQAPVHSAESISMFPLSLRHTDICGPIDPPSICGEKYAVVFLEDFTKISSVNFMKDRRKFADSLVSYRALVDNKQGKRMYRLSMDRAGGNTSSAVGRFTSENGIVLNNSSSLTPRSRTDWPRG